MEESTMSITKVLIAIDQLANACLGGYPDETISAKVYRKALTGKVGWTTTEKFINFLFQDPNHCKEAHESEVEGTQTNAEYRKK
jgi:hypothetical protein